MPVTCRPVTDGFNEPSSLRLGIDFMRSMVSVLVTEYALAPLRWTVYALMVPFCWATYNRPSGPNCSEVGLTEVAFWSKLLPKLTGVVVWVHDGCARSVTMPATTTAVVSAKMRRNLAGILSLDHCLSVLTIGHTVPPRIIAFRFVITANQLYLSYLCCRECTVRSRWEIYAK